MERKDINNQANLRRTIINALRAHEILMRFLRQDSGLTIVEYALAAGLIVASVAATFGILGTTIDAILATLMAFL